MPPATSDRPAGGAHAASSCDPADTLETVLANLYELSGEHIDADAPLLESGLDSVGAVELLGNQLQQPTGEDLPAILVFDHPIARQLADYFASIHMQLRVCLYAYAVRVCLCA